MIANQKIATFVDVLDKISQKGHNVPGLIMSSPGYGKTSTIEMYCKFKDYNLTVLIASQYAPDDILGLQAVKDGRLERLTPSWFNDMVELSKNGKRNVLFIDEITTCDEFIQAPLMNLIFTRKLNNNISLPENTVIISAGNYPEELNNAFKLALPLVNRFLVLNLGLSDYDFQEVFMGTFSRVTEYELYLNLKPVKDPYWDYGSIAKFIKYSIAKKENVKIKINNSAKTGLCGFISVRSLDYCLKFLSVYCSNYSSEFWVNIVGDTLGYGVANLLLSNKYKFIKARDVKEEEVNLSLKDRLKLYEQADGESKELIKNDIRFQVFKDVEAVTDEEMSILARTAGLEDIVNDIVTRIS